MKKLFLSFLMAFSAFITAQEIEIVSGDFNFLKDQTEVNVELKFNDVLFMAENISESQYLENRKKQVVENPKRGEEGWATWSEAWEKYKSEEYINYLIKGLNRYSKK